MVGTFNIGISRYVSKENQLMAVKVLEYVTSELVQINSMKHELIISAISSIYDNKEICSFFDCNLYKNIQFIGKLANASLNYDEYSEKFRKKVYDFLYGNEDDAYKVLKDIDDFTRIYYISINTEESYVGLIFTIIYSVMIFVFLISLNFLFNKDYDQYFKFLSNDDLWIVVIIGFIVFLCSGFTLIGPVTPTKCYLKPLLLSVGMILNFSPILYQLIINFNNENNKLISRITRHRYLFIFCLIFINLLIYIIPFFTSPFSIIKINGDLEDEKIFQKCKMGNINLVIYNLSIFYQLIILFVVLFLIFMEWNNQYINNDLKLLISGAYTTLFYFVVFLIFEIGNINNYIYYFILWESGILISAFSNYFFFYGHRIILGLLDRGNKKEIYLSRTNKNFINNDESNKKQKSSIDSNEMTTNNNGNVTTFMNNNGENSHEVLNKSSLFIKILDYRNNPVIYNNAKSNNTACYDEENESFS